ncbi:MAG: M1 family metallopeptidase [Ignavibacteriaceae bacterium]
MTKTYKIILPLFIIIVFFLGLKAAGLRPAAKPSLIKNISSRLIISGDLEPVPPDDYASGNQYKINVLHYFINVDLYPAEKTLKGDVIITGKFLDKNINQIDLNFYDNMKISSLLLNGKVSSFTENGRRLSIPLYGSRPDSFEVHVVYSGTPKHLGFSSFVFGEINGKSCTYNLSEPNYASTWFPCNDIPSDKALVDIKITNDSSEVSASNGKLVSITGSGSRKTYYWKTVYPISTYLIGLYSSNYVNFSDKYISQDKADTMEIEYYVFPKQLEDAKKDFRDLPEMIDYFSKTFGEYPFIKEKFGITEFLWQYGAMETQTLVGVGSNFVGGLNFYTEIYTHELAHHWFGDAVGPATWKDIWLNEGFATYSEALYSEHLGGPGALKSSMMSKLDVFDGTLYNPNDLFSHTVYDKGAWVLHMLRHETGDSVFFKILRDYYQSYKYKSASTKDFEDLCEKVSGRNLSVFFDQWVFKGSGMLTLNYSWNMEKAGNIYFVTLNVNQTQTGYSAYNFPLDLKILYSDKTTGLKTFIIDKRQNTIKLELSKEPVELTLDPDNWLPARIQNGKNGSE